MCDYLSVCVCRFLRAVFRKCVGDSRGDGKHGNLHQNG